MIRVDDGVVFVRDGVLEILPEVVVVGSGRHF